MILDEVLESRSFDTDSMVDMFVEGFLFALEMQENGEKASSIEELSETLSEAANEAISELSKVLAAHASAKATRLGTEAHRNAADRFEKNIKNGGCGLGAESEHLLKTIDKRYNQAHKFADYAVTKAEREKKIASKLKNAQNKK